MLTISVRKWLDEDCRFLDGAEETGCREMITERDILSRYCKVSTRCSVAASSNT